MFKASVTLAITGASGSCYAIALLKSLITANLRIYLIISNAAKQVITTETALNLPKSNSALNNFFNDLCAAKNKQLILCNVDDWFVAPASGSSDIFAMIIAPCSMGTISAIAHGASNNLIERAADVMLKEQRKLIIMPRETPFSSIHLTNMLALSNAGAVIVPACPGFYHNPQNLDDITNFMVAKVLNLLDIKQDFLPKWGQ